MSNTEAIDEAAKGACADARRLAEWVGNEQERKSRMWLTERATDPLNDCDPERAGNSSTVPSAMEG